MNDITAEPEIAAVPAGATLPPMEDPLWFKDAIIYQLHLKSFFDGNNDGVGDFQGLMEKLDYIAELGVTARLAATTATTSPTIPACTRITARSRTSPRSLTPPMPAACV